MNAAATLLVDSRCALGEGIVWCERRQLLYWCDIDGARLWRFDPATGRAQSWLLHEPVACVALSDGDDLLLGLAKGLYRCDVEGSLACSTLTPQLLAQVEPELGSTRTNDGRADRDGNFVFGTKGADLDGAPLGRFYQYSARHGLRPLALPLAAIPNSIGFDASGRRMIFCDSPDGRIRRCAYDADRADVSEIVDLVVPDGAGEPDGSCVDAEDALWNAQWGAARVVRYTRDGAIDRIVEVPASQASCCVIGGAGLDTLFITSARTGMDRDALQRELTAGGVFSLALGQALGRPADRVRLA
jgi:L-arabinonolactonase